LEFEESVHPETHDAAGFEIKLCCGVLLLVVGAEAFTFWTIRANFLGWGGVERE
jgi:hypothetical protein